MNQKASGWISIASEKLISVWKKIPLSVPVKSSLAIAIPVLSFIGLIGLSGSDSVEFKMKENLPATPAKMKGYAPVDDNVLQIIQVTPEGEISQGDERKEIFVAFNHPVVPLAALDEQTKGVFAVSPPVKGKFRWYGSRICAFVPEENYAEGKVYTITVNDGLTALNGKKFQGKQKYSFSLKIPPISVMGLEPYNYTPIRYNQKFTLSLNFPATHEMLQKHIQIKAGGKSVDFAIKDIKPETSEYDDTLSGGRRRRTYSWRILPSSVLPRDTEVKFRISKGLKAHKVNTSLPSDYDRTYKTYGDFTFKAAVSPQSWNERYNSEIFFSNPVSPKEVMRAIQTSPKIALLSRFREVSDIQSISLNSWDIKPGMKVKFKVGAMKDVMGNVLKNPGAFDIVMPDRESFFSLADYGKVVESKMGQRIPLEISNMDQISINYAPFELSDVFKSLDKNKALASFLKMSNANFSTGVKKNKVSTVFYDFSKLDMQGSNWGVISFLDNENRAQTSVIQVTDLGITARTAHNGVHVWVHSLQTAQPVEKAQANAYFNSDKEGKCTTDAAGYCFIKLKEDHREVKERVYLVHVQSAKDSAYVDSENFSQYISVRGGESAYEGSRLKHTEGMIFFDRRLYRPGETMHFKAVLSERKYGQVTAVANESITAEIKDSQGESVWTKNLKTSAQGGLHGSYEISKEGKLGHYTLTVRSGDDSQESVQETFQVEEFRPVTFSVKGTLPESVKSGAQASAVIEGKYLFGAPMGGANVKYTVNRVYRPFYSDTYSDFSFADDLRYEYGYNVSLETGYLTGGSGKLDATGAYSFAFKASPLVVLEQIDLPAKKSITMSAPFALSLEATVKDVDDRSVTNTAEVDVDIAQGPLGVRVNDRYKQTGTPFSFEVISLDKYGNKLLKPRNLTVRVIRNVWKSARVKGAGGSTQVKNTLVRELVEENTLTVTGEPTPYQYTPDSSGEYTITFQDQSGVAYTRAMFYAYGKSASFFLPDDDTLTISADKATYKAGDVAKILVKSPYPEGRVVYSLEREKVIFHKQMAIPGQAFVIEVPIKEEYLPNVYLSVGIIRARNSIDASMPAEIKQVYMREDLGAPRFKFASVNLKVDNSSRLGALAIATNRESYGPGDNVVLDISADPDAEIAVSVADRGVLDLLNYSYAEASNRIYNNWPLEIGLLENRRYLVRQYHPGMKGASPGGDGYGEGGGGFSLDSEDGTRKDFRYTAFWKADIKANSQGKAKVEFKLPDNLSTFRIMAVSISKGKYKSLNKEFQVKKALVVQKLVPRFIRPGDTLEIGAVVINQTSVDTEFTAEIKSELLGAQGKKSVQLKAGEAKEVTFSASLSMNAYKNAKKKFDPEKALKAEKPGVPAIEVVGYIGAYPTDASGLKAKGYKDSDFQDKLKFTFPVFEMYPAEAFAISGFTAQKQEEAVILPAGKKAISGLGTFDMTMSSTALSGLEKAFRFYGSSPYYCLEQRASAYLLSLTSGDLLKEFGAPVPGQDAFDFTRIENLFLGELGDFQDSNGGFRAWKNTSSAQGIYLTTYVADVLLTAQEMGKKIPEERLKKAMGYIAKYLKDPERGNRVIESENLAYIAYVMAQSNMAAGGLHKALLKRSADLSLRAKGYLAMAIAISEKASKADDDKNVRTLLDDIKRRMQVTTQSVMFEEKADAYLAQAYYARGSTTAVILQSLMMLDKDNQLIPGIVNYLMNDRKSTFWHDTHSSGKLAQALHKYHQTYEKSASGSIAAEILLAGKSIWADKLDTKKTQVLKRSFPLEELAATHPADKQLPLVFDNTNKSGRLYYTARLFYAPAAGAEKARDEGIEIHRRMYHVSISQGRQKLTRVKESDLQRGELYLTRLSLVNSKPYFNAVVVDPLASNVEIMNTEYATEAKPEATVNAEDDREPKPHHRQDAYDDYGFISHREFRDDKVVIFSDFLQAGYHEFTYFARPIVKGKAGRPGSIARLMYEPEIFGRSASDISKVR